MNIPVASAVVFAYSDIGVRGLETLLSCGVDVKLVVSHPDKPGENLWFASVAELAALNGIEVLTPQDANAPDVVERVTALQPDLLFSFYFRQLLGAALLDIPRYGAFNLHGSLLPHYRGCAPVNWAVLNGETQTGASLHQMVVRADAGDVVDQMAVPILPNDTAYQVHLKVAVAAELVLLRSVPALMAGDCSAIPQSLESGSYFGRRKPEDGRIDWTWPAQRIHNLIRAVAPPYPGAFFDLEDGRRLLLLGSYYHESPARQSRPSLYWEAGHCWADCSDGRRLCILRMALDGVNISQAEFENLFGQRLDLPIQETAVQGTAI